MKSANRAFIISMVLHVSFFLALLLVILWEHLFKPSRKDYVFEMVTSSSAVQEPVQKKLDSGIKPISPIRTKSLPPVKSYREAKPQSRKLAPQKKPKPKVKRPDLVKASPRKTYKDFAKNNPIKTPKKIQTKKQKPSPRTTTMKTVNMDVSQLRKSLSSIKLNPKNGEKLSSVQKSMIASYGNELRAKIEAEWIISDNTLSAEVTIHVSANGMLTSFISSQSGNRAFDQSILDAVGAIQMEPPPNGKSRSFSITLSASER